MDYSLIKNITIRFFQEKRDLLVYCSILLGIGSKSIQQIAEKQYSAIKSATAESIIPAIHSILAKTGVKKEDITAITTTTGPGAFTSIRITLSSVIAISLGLKIPVYTLDSLKTSALAAFYSKKIQEKQNPRKNKSCPKSCPEGLQRRTLYSQFF